MANPGYEQKAIIYNCPDENGRRAAMLIIGLNEQGGPMEVSVKLRNLKHFGTFQKFSDWQIHLDSIFDVISFNLVVGAGLKTVVAEIYRLAEDLRGSKEHDGKFIREIFLSAAKWLEERFVEGGRRQ